MGETEIAERLLLLLHQRLSKESGAGGALLGWANAQRAHFWPNVELGSGKKPLRWKDIPRLCKSEGIARATPGSLVTARAVSGLLKFDAFETELLQLAVAMQRLPRLSTLRIALAEAGVDIVSLYGVFAGAPEDRAAQQVRRSLTVSLGLIQIEVNRRGIADIDTEWRFDELLDRDVRDEDQLIEALVGIRQHAKLSPADFPDHRTAIDFLVRLMRGALEQRAIGVNVLLHGPPGTGKTELARAIAAEVGALLFAVGEADTDGDEPNRWVRLHALRRAHRLLGRRTDSILLFDEMEDLFAATAARPKENPGSKVFVNRLLEQNVVPTIWTSNAIGQLDPAYLRRFSFVLDVGHPSARSRASIVQRIAADEAMAGAVEEVAGLLPDNPETPSVARAALRAARLAGNHGGDAALASRSLLTGLNHGEPLPLSRGRSALQLDLVESDPPLAPLLRTITATDAPADFSMLLSGPPGTGKTELAHYLAGELGRPLLVKRTSDLLSKWLGGTEANIARSFDEARRDGAVLLFDEVDSLLRDRSGAARSWEVTQVNELLTWMECHDLPFIAATNHPDRLDPAAMRRFVFKIRLRDLSPENSRRAFARFFGAPAPPRLDRLAGLTAGDFAVVARQLRYRKAHSPDAIVDMLAGELANRIGPARIGF